MNPRDAHNAGTVDWEVSLLSGPPLAFAMIPVELEEWHVRVRPFVDVVIAVVSPCWSVDS